MAEEQQVPSSLASLRLTVLNRQSIMQYMKAYDAALSSKV